MHVMLSHKTSSTEILLSLTATTRSDSRRCNSSGLAGLKPSASAVSDVTEGWQSSSIIATQSQTMDVGVAIAAPRRTGRRVGLANEQTAAARNTEDMASTSALVG